MTHVREMTRDELVSEVRDMVLWGMACHHEIGDPTILPAPKLRALLVTLRMRSFAGLRCKHT
jgi:hypothetical protein